MSLGIVLISLVLSPSIDTSCFAQEIKKIPGTITSGDIGPGKNIISTPVAPVGQAWVLVNTTEPVICYTEETGKQIILQLENSNDYKTQVDLYKQGNVELEKQIDLLKETLVLQKQQRDVADQTIESYKKLITVQKDAYEKQIENNKPSIWGKIGAALGGLGIGALIGLLLL